jgi:hypothetical protein
LDCCRSTALIKELDRLESWVAQLQPPKWDESMLGKIDADLATHGRALYASHCAPCHSAPPYERTDPNNNIARKTFIAIKTIDYLRVGTDPVYSESFARRLVRTNGVTSRAHEGRSVVEAERYFRYTIGAIVKRAMIDLNIHIDEQSALHGFRFGNDRSLYTQTCIPCLKAGPLPGIWASGPYLHNGSVPTIYDLLSPVSERPKIFATGFRELDNKNLGFVSSDAPGRFRFDTSIPGNSNAGHTYPPTGLTPAEGLAIIEYLKTL